MAMTEEITPELRALIEPHLREVLLEEDYDLVDDMFSEVVYTQPEGIPLVALMPPHGEGISLQFSCLTGEFVELTDWDYVQTVDVEEQERAHRLEDMRGAIETALRHYHKEEYQTVTDYQKVIDNRTELTVDGVTLYKYDCPLQTIYLKEDNYPVTQGNQKVDSTYYYYTFSGSNIDPEHDVDKYTYKVSYEWKRNENIWQ
jgi:hypothetical protein